MDDPFASEALGIAGGLGHVVLVGEEDVADSSHGLEALDEMGKELGRVDEPVAVRIMDEVAMASVGLGRVEAVVVDPFVQGHGEIAHDLAGGMEVERTDGPRRASEQGLQGFPLLLRGSRLGIHVRRVASFGERLRSEQAARPAVDAGGVHVVFPGDVIGKPLLEGRHGSPLSCRGNPESTRDGAVMHTATDVEVSCHGVILMTAHGNSNAV
ncbi:hypothetical protein D3C87_1557590 [compost metagenome]